MWDFAERNPVTFLLLACVAAYTLSYVVYVVSDVIDGWRK